MLHADTWINNTNRKINNWRSGPVGLTKFNISKFKYRNPIIYIASNPHNAKTDYNGYNSVASLIVLILTMKL